MKGQEKHKLIENDDKPSRKFEYQKDEPEIQTSGKTCLCCAENIAESIQSKKTKYPLLGESNTKVIVYKLYFISYSIVHSMTIEHNT